MATPKTNRSPPTGAPWELSAEDWNGLVDDTEAAISAEAAARAAGDQAIIDAGVQVGLADASYVKARGSTTSLQLQDWMAQVVNAKAFGAVGDAIFNKTYDAITAPYGTVTGTDDTAAIQDAIDYAVANRKGTVYLPAGTYRITSKLDLNAASGFSNISLVGDGVMYAGESPFSGTAIIADFSAGPALEFNGTRSSTIRDLTLVGRNWAFLAYQTPGGSGTAPDFSVEANWVEPTLATESADIEDDPYCGIAVNLDPVSSRVLLDRVQVLGFIVGVGVGMDGGQYNGDFVAIRDSTIAYNKYGLSVGNFQARTTNATNSNISHAWTAIATNRHGAKNGRLSGAFTNCVFDNSYKLASFGQSSTMGGVTFLRCYAETLGGLGSLAEGSTAADLPINFVGCLLEFASPETNTVPRVHLSTANTPVYFDACVLQVHGPFCYDGAVYFTNGTMINRGADEYPVPAATNEYRLADRGMSGIFPPVSFPDFVTNPVSVVYMGAADIETSTDFNARLDMGVGPRIRPSSAWVRKTTAFESIQRGLGVTLDLAATPLTIVSQPDAITWELQFSTHIAGEKVKLIQGGDLYYDSTTGTRYRIVSVVGTVVTIQLVSGFSYRGATLATAYAPTLNAGTGLVICSRVFSVVALWGDFTSGSAVITNVGNGDGIMATNPGAGDWLVSNTYLQGAYGPPRDANYDATIPEVLSVDGGARTITLDANAGTTATKVPIGLWLRPT